MLSSVFTWLWRALGAISEGNLHLGCQRVLELVGKNDHFVTTGSDTGSSDYRLTGGHKSTLSYGCDHLQGKYH